MSQPIRIVFAAALALSPAAVALAHSPATSGTQPWDSTPEIAAMSNEIARQYSEPARRVDAIIQRIFWKDGGLGFEYRSHPTLTAAEAFTERRGNCLSLVNLFVAMGREVGLRVFFVEVEDFETFYKYEGTIVRSTHIVGGLILDGELRTVDFMPDRDKRYRSLQIASDQRAAAHYYNGVGAEAMLDGDLERAEALLSRARLVDPTFVGAMNNHAILARRKGHLEEAIDTLERSLLLEPHFLPAMENLSGYYRLAGRFEAAERMENRALGERTRNPFYLTHQAYSRFLQGDLDQAERLLKRARRLDNHLPEVHLLLGRVALARGDAEAAEGHFARARKMSTEYPEVFRTQLDSKIKRLVVASRH